jgi:hypothetical protein
MHLISIVGWVIWATSIHNRRSADSNYRAKWHEDFCRRQRLKAGHPEKV